MFKVVMASGRNDCGFPFPRPRFPPAVLRGAELSEETQPSFLPSVFPYSWLQETLPAWGSHLLTVVRPGLQLAWTHTNATVSFLSAHCASHLAWFGDSLTSLSQRVSQRRGGWRMAGVPRGWGVQPHVEWVLRTRMHCPGGLASPLSAPRLQAQLPATLTQLLQSLRELLLLLHQNVLLPLWHILLEALAQAREHCHEACR